MLGFPWSPSRQRNPSQRADYSNQAKSLCSAVSSGDVAIELPRHVSSKGTVAALRRGLLRTARDVDDESGDQGSKLSLWRRRLSRNTLSF